MNEDKHNNNDKKDDDPQASSATDAGAEAPPEPDTAPHAEAAVAPESASATAKSEATSSTSPSPAAAPVAAAPVARGARAIAALALLLALAAAAAAGWMYLKLQAQQAEYAEREQRLVRQVKDIRDTADDARRSIGEAIDASRQTTLAVSERLADERQRFEAQLSDTRDSLDAVQSALLRQRQQLVELRSTDRVDWSLAGAEYLLRLGYQRLLMARDADSALALLVSADGILEELDDTDLLPARSAIAEDMAALRAIPELDVEGTWLRLQALAGRVDKLILFELPQARQETPAVDPDAGWRERLSQGIDAALQKISDYLVIRRREEPYAVLLDPQWEQLVRQNLRMQLAQAQAALLSGNALLYQASLDATRRWLGEFFDFNEAEVQALNAELDALVDVQVSRDLPDIGGSLSALKAVIDTRHEVD
ncbi:MAG: uroporphyrinogen-III C-methyltransferase [Halieaceae bacterium]|nr:uroporphyrinogen-III C-methyltransferase [Halieaceae bacterium]